MSGRVREGSERRAERPRSLASDEHEEKSFWKEVTCSEMLSRAVGLWALWEVDWGQEGLGTRRFSQALTSRLLLVRGKAVGGVSGCPVAQTVAATWGGSHLPVPRAKGTATGLSAPLQGGRILQSTWGAEQS